MIVYATVADLETWIDGDVPDTAELMLREASILVAAACRADLYDTTVDGLPVDPVLAGAMLSATCIQTHVWIAASLDPVAGPGGQTPRMTVSGIDGANVSYDTYLTADARAQMLTGLVPNAVRVLRAEGLASGLVRS